MAAPLLRARRLMTPARGHSQAKDKRASYPIKILEPSAFRRHNCDPRAKRGHKAGYLLTFDKSSGPPHAFVLSRSVDIVFFEYVYAYPTSTWEPGEALRLCRKSQYHVYQTVRGRRPPLKMQSHDNPEVGGVTQKSLKSIGPRIGAKVWASLTSVGDQKRCHCPLTHSLYCRRKRTGTLVEARADLPPVHRNRGQAWSARERRSPFILLSSQANAAGPRQLRWGRPTAEAERN